MSRERRAREGGEGDGAARRDMIVSRRDDPDGIGRQRRSGSFARVFTSLRCRVRVYARAPLATVPHQRASRHPRNTVKFAPFGSSAEEFKTRTAIRGSLRFAAVRVLRQRMSRGAPGPWVQVRQLFSRERFPFGIAFDARFDRCASSSPRRTADPPNKRRARLMLMPRAKRLSRDCQERASVTRVSSSIHSLGWTSSGSETVAWPAYLSRLFLISRALRRRGGRSVETDPNAPFFFRRVASRRRSLVPPRTGA